MIIVLKAKEFAPFKTGGIISGIRAQHRKKESVVISEVNKSFPYHKWVNVTSPYKRISLIPKFRPRGMKKVKRFFYADIPTKTGSPGYFDLAIDYASLKAGKIAVKNVRMALK